MSKSLDWGEHKEVKTGAGRTGQDGEKECRVLLSIVHRTDSPSMHVASGFPHHQACSQVGKEHLGLSHPSSPPHHQFIPFRHFAFGFWFLLLWMRSSQAPDGGCGCMRETGLGIREPSLEMGRENTSLRTCRPVPYFLQLDQPFQRSVASPKQHQPRRTSHVRRELVGPFRFFYLSILTSSGTHPQPAGMA